MSPVDPVPLRMALQNTKRRGSPTHRRTDSTDSSNTSRDSNYGEHSPSKDCADFPIFTKSQSEPLEGKFMHRVIVTNLFIMYPRLFIGHVWKERLLNT